jgi:diaminopimelate epimerase
MPSPPDHPLRIAKAHAYGNDFLYVCASDVEGAGLDPVDLARRACERRTGIGADGLIVFTEHAEGASMRLINPDGSRAEVSGNGVRGLGALLARARGWTGAGGVARHLAIDTEAGEKRLDLLEGGGSRFLFRAAMGTPKDVERISLDVAGERVDATRLDVGNPQCIVFGSLDEARLARLGRALQSHPAFPQAVNFELVDVVDRGRLRILIWERGAGRTESSGTGSCASAAAAIVHGLADRVVDVSAPGGTQRVEWTDDGLFLTGWAEVLFEGRWVADADAAGSLRRG